MLKYSQPPIVPLTERSKLARVKSLSKSPSKPKSPCRNARIFERQKDVRCSDISFQEFTRHEAERALRLQPNGTYLVRTGGKGKNKAFALSLKTSSASGFDHYRIEVSDDLFFIEKGLKFPTFAELIARYQQEKLPVLAAQLLYPLVTAQNFERVYSSRLFDEDAFDLEEQAQPIGSGEFGQVYAATWRETGKRVAVKEIKLPLRRSGTEKSNPVNANTQDLPVRLDEFSEIRLMSKLFNDKAGHHNIMEHYGIQYAPGRHLRIILQLMTGGSLLEALKTVGKTRLRNAELLTYSLQMCSALKYLKDSALLHRDIAARNILLDESLSSAKLADFGLAVTVDELRSSTHPIGNDIDALLKSKIAVKWTAPEALEKGLYSFQSEVWSFGILLWEMWSYGRVPYRKIYVENVLTEIKRGTRCELLDSPDLDTKMPPKIRELLNADAIWSIEPNKRPIVEQIKQKILFSKSMFNTR